MKRLSITIVILLVVFTMACKKSSEIPGREGPGFNSGTTQSAPVSVTAPGMNPPHGQPNHRCDIAVGVPLDSPPGTGKSAPPAVSQQITPGQGNTTPTAPGMNPPHGQPNHRCDIAVGVPLDSPPGMQLKPPSADSLNSPNIRIVPAPNPDATGK